MSRSKDPWEVLFGLLVAAVVIGVIAAGVGLLAAAGAGAYGAYALASAAGAGKAWAVVAGVGGLIAGPFVAAKSWKGYKNWKKEKNRSSYQSPVPTFSRASTPAPQPQPQPAPKVQPSVESPDNIPLVFTDAMEKLKAMEPEERNKYLDKLRDAFPNDVETLHSYDEKMALKKPATAMKPLTLVSKQNTAP
ncbi:MAG: hypothetical protein ACAH83_10270 [Alphaproteobacteria bacterium]